ncbi:MAG: riboflavin synthase [Microcystaceae cyanobacterium]
MFTGLIQGLGKLQGIGSDRFSITLTDIERSSLVSDLALGDSVAVDGVCLTVEEILADGFVATASPETLKRTTLGNRLHAASSVNLEPSLKVGSKLGGHFVTGHVDGIGCLAESIISEKAWEMTFTAPSGLIEQWEQYISPYIVSKGSISVNGISLTVADCDSQGSWFKVAVIPVTYKETNLSQLKIGDWVNLEGDILGKYVEKLLGHRTTSANKSEDISLSFLTEHGYI